VNRDADLHDPRAVEILVESVGALGAELGRPATFMEVCGTHTHSIAAAGLRRMLPAGVRLISGPGCPVCVTPIEYMDRAVALARRPDVIVCTFGDLMRVPSSQSSLERESARGGDIRIVYSARDAIRVARDNPGKRVVFLGVGFETTLPTVAAAIAEAEQFGVDNLLVLPGAKLIEPPLRALIADGDVHVDGFLLPGHVSVILGADFYAFLEDELRVPAVIVGFTPVDVLLGVTALLRQLVGGEARVENLYARVVTPEGNRVARELMNTCFEPEDTGWRGLGVIPRSGLALRPRYRKRDASLLDVQLDPACEPLGCRCGDVLRGAIEPPECPLFESACTPSNPVGACMVSSEGTCAAWYRHERAYAEVQR
jgi:hydrogenase expression/formation protein HypD